MSVATVSDIRTWLREPLLHFLAVGAALFLLYRAVSGEAEGPREIVVSEARIEALAGSFARTWMRPPTAEEIRGLVDDYIKEEIYYREAMAIGLDRDDTVIRRRLRQKLEFLSDDVAAAKEPTDAELQAYMEGNAEKFVSLAQFSFQQVLFSSDKRGGAALRDAGRALDALAAGEGQPDAGQAGDPSLLPPRMEGASPRDIANVFGEAFAAEVEAAPLERWIGPVESPFGVHLVRLSAREDGKLPLLEEIRPVVLREWQTEQQQGVSAAFYDGLRTKYKVRIEGELGELLRRQADRTQPSTASDGRS
jgi:PPIC-type PPIASE domain